MDATASRTTTLNRIIPLALPVVLAVAACGQGPTTPAGDSGCLWPSGTVDSYTLGSRPEGSDDGFGDAYAGTEANWKRVGDNSTGILDLGPEDVEQNLAQLIVWVGAPSLREGGECRMLISFGQYSTTDVAVGTSEELNAKYYETLQTIADAYLFWPEDPEPPASVLFRLNVQQVTDPVLGIPDGPVINLGGEVRFR